MKDESSDFFFLKKKEFCLLLINPISPEKTNGKVGGYQVDR